MRIVKDNIGKFIATIFFMITFAIMIPEFKQFTVLTLILVLMSYGHYQIQLLKVQRLLLLVEIQKLVLIFQ